VRNLQVPARLARYRIAAVEREVTLAQVLCWMLALVGSIAALCWAGLQFLADHEQPAALFAAGGFALVFWAALHLADRPPHHS
jgi:hypothetical protein